MTDTDKEIRTTTRNILSFLVFLIIVFTIPIFVVHQAASFIIWEQITLDISLWDPVSRVFVLIWAFFSLAIAAALIYELN